MLYQSTQELKDSIHRIYGKTQSLTIKDGVYEQLHIYFAMGTPQGQPGDFCYSDENGYHYCSIGDRGEVFPEKITTSLFESTYWVIKLPIQSMSSKFESRHRVQGQDFRRIVFQKMIQYWDAIGSEYALRAEQDIAKTLAKYPFIDL